MLNLKINDSLQSSVALGSIQALQSTSQLERAKTIQETPLQTIHL